MLTRRGLPLAWAMTLPDYVSDLRFSPDGLLLAAATLAGPVVVMEPDAGTIRYQLDGHDGGSLTLDWSPDGKLLATGGQGGDARIVQGETGVTVALMEAGAEWVERVAWSPDGRSLGVAAGKSVRFFSSTGKLLGEVKDHASTITSLLWLPRSELAVTACYGGVQFLSVNQSTPVKSYAWKGSMLTLVVTPNGKYLASGNQDNSIHVWRTSNGEDFQMTGYPSKVKVLAFSRNAQTLASGGGNTVILWDFSGKGPAGRKPQMLRGHTGMITDLVFTESHGQRRLVSVAQDGELCTWALQLSTRPVTTNATDAPLERVAMDPRGRFLVAANRNGQVLAFLHG
jgi:WD40 repeat protein